MTERHCPRCDRVDEYYKGINCFICGIETHPTEDCSRLGCEIND